MYSNNSDHHKFVTVRRSRKGINLNIPEEFNKIHREQTSIMRVGVLPTVGCCDMDYVLFRKNAHNCNLVSYQAQTRYDNCLPGYPSSVIINIGSPLITQKQVYHSCRRQKSHSTLSINPTEISEEPLIPRKNMIPTGLYCCSDRPTCEHTESQEQGVINLDVSKAELDDDKYVYITVAPKISPLKSFLNFLTCKRKKYQGEPYNPTVMTKNKTPLECFGCPKDVEKSGKLSFEKKHISFVPSRLSTITESDVTISDYSSEEFNPNGSKQKPKKIIQGSHKQSDLETNREFCSLDFENTFAEKTVVRNLNSVGSHLPHLYPEGEIHRWVCKPSGDHGKRDKRYICYLKQ